MLWKVAPRWSAAVGAMCLTGAASGQAFDDAAVLKLNAAGLGDGAIIAKVSASPCAYDLSTDRLIALKRAGLSDRVITAMVERCAGSSRAQGQAAADPTAAHRPGIYVEQDEQGGRALAMLRPTVANGVHLSGNGSILFPFKATLTVPQGAAQLKVKGGAPTFWFHFDPADERVGDFGGVGTAAAQSPGEFSLVRFRVDGGSRHFVIGKVKGTGGSVGIDPRNTLPFTVSETGDGVFKVVLPALEPGEYGFVLPGDRGRYRIYDFAITPG